MSKSLFWETKTGYLATAEKPSVWLEPTGLRLKPSDASSQSLVSFPDWLSAEVWIAERNADGDETGVIQWEWWPVHARMVADLEEKKLVVLKGRQQSWSWLVASNALYNCLSHPQYRVLMLSQTEPDAWELLDKARFVYSHLKNPTVLLERGPDKKGAMGFANGAAIIALPSSKRAGSGYTASLVIVDEAAKHQWAEDNYTSYKPTVDAGGKLWIISSAWGAGNFFHKMYLGARDHTNGFVSRFYGWFERPGRDQAWLEARRLEYAALPGKLEQEYPTNDDDAFLLSGRPRFSIEAIREHRTRVRAALA